MHIYVIIERVDVEDIDEPDTMDVLFDHRFFTSYKAAEDERKALGLSNCKTVQLRKA